VMRKSEETVPKVKSCRLQVVGLSVPKIFQTINIQGIRGL
jgi:hypothetical protein